MGAVIGTAEWFALRRCVSWLWIPATCAGMAAGLTVGAATVDHRMTRGDLALMGAVTGVGIGALQALILVLAGQRTSAASLWAGRTRPPLRSVGS